MKAGCVSDSLVAIKGSSHDEGVAPTIYMLDERFSGLSIRLIIA